MKIIVELTEDKYEIADRLDMMVAINDALENLDVSIKDIYFDKVKETAYREAKERLFVTGKTS